MNSRFLRSLPKDRSKRIATAEVSEGNILPKRTRSGIQKQITTPDKIQKRSSKVKTNKRIVYENDEQSSPESPPTSPIQSTPEPVISTTKSNPRKTLKIIKSPTSTESRSRIENSENIGNKIMEQITRLGGTFDRSSYRDGTIQYRGAMCKVHSALHLLSTVTWPANTYYRSTIHEMRNIEFGFYDVEPQVWDESWFLSNYKDQVVLIADSCGAHPILTLKNEPGIYTLDLDKDYVMGPQNVLSFLTSLSRQDSYIPDESTEPDSTQSVVYSVCK
ncbi:adenosine deaminase CECR1 [Acrasis kona]|uniref:Adenosine deaminase CECR1 n=1 Tax=Acrasis kona TaxID=1008807 RepID=A0AAW2ZP53_9EUKA